MLHGSSHLLLDGLRSFLSILVSIFLHVDNFIVLPHNLGTLVVGVRLDSIVLVIKFLQLILHFPIDPVLILDFLSQYSIGLLSTLVLILHQSYIRL